MDVQCGISNAGGPQVILIEFEGLLSRRGVLLVCWIVACIEWVTCMKRKPRKPTALTTRSCIKLEVTAKCWSDQEEGVKVSGTEVRAGRVPATSALRVCMAGQ